MSDIKIFAKNEKEFEILMQIIRIDNQYRGIKFRNEKCAMLTMKREKRNNRRNRTVQLGKHKNTRRKRKLRIPENIGIRNHQANRD